MDDDHIPHSNKPLTHNLIYKQNPAYLLITTSTIKEDSKLLNPLNKSLRKSIAPLSHLPTNSYKLFKMNNDLNHPLNKNYLSEEARKQFRPNIKATSICQINKETEDENNFDLFILQNFTPFSGEQDVNQWLSETKMKFSRLLIPRNLRFTAIPLLVKGPAKK
ncbi:unnamed protein product, partial [Rotaria sp. Silwood1]